MQGLNKDHSKVSEPSCRANSVMSVLSCEKERVKEMLRSKGEKNKNKDFDF